jgi:opacity protein-like surface antigen
MLSFVGAGIGISRVEVNDRNVLDGGTRVARFTNDNENQFAWQLTLGVGYNVAANVTAEIAYRYADLGEVELTSTVGNVSSSPQAYSSLESVPPGHRSGECRLR